MNAQHRFHPIRRIALWAIAALALILTVAFVVPESDGTNGGCAAAAYVDLTALENAPAQSPGAQSGLLPVNRPVRSGEQDAQQVYIVLDDGRSEQDSDGNCAVPPNDNKGDQFLLEASAKLGADIWSEPDVWSGRVIESLQVGQRVLVSSIAVRGPVRYDDETLGNWYWVYQGGAHGWVKSEQLVVAGDRAGLATIAASASANGRLWSVPDARTGHVVGLLEAGEPVNVIRGPVDGRAPDSAAAWGLWYQVLRGNGDAGWVWIERLVTD